ncbi:hypothetical protein SBRY_20403 [Actinacidiphila bryophytorum]|uniref:Uncharacterized protein n=1 Tax=Actinacidiphila bryophytorum TaxID=1436133 RepID=A0A9W4GY57_9ACTN|nr:hypothetical protein SBRY_20403 [Actinacidiphila bryophytorum]
MAGGAGLAAQRVSALLLLPPRDAGRGAGRAVHPRGVPRPPAGRLLRGGGPRPGPGVRAVAGGAAGARGDLRRRQPCGERRLAARPARPGRRRLRPGGACPDAGDRTGRAGGTDPQRAGRRRPALPGRGSGGGGALPGERHRCAPAAGRGARRAPGGADAGGQVGGAGGDRGGGDGFAAGRAAGAGAAPAGGLARGGLAHPRLGRLVTAGAPSAAPATDVHRTASRRPLMKHQGNSR